MPDLVVLASSGTYAASLGWILDAHSVLGELYDSNASLSDYSRMATGLSLLTRDGGPALLAGGRSLPSDGGLGSASAPRLIYLPAFDCGPLDHLHDALREDRRVSDWLRAQHGGGAIVAASGASVWRLAQAGLFVATRAAVEPRLAPAFRRAFPRIDFEPLQGLSASGQVMSCAAASLEREFVLRVIARALSFGVAEWLDMRWGGRAEGGHAQSADPLVSRAELWIREHFTENLRIQDLAAALSVSHQTLTRRFRLALGITPLDYTQKLRVQAAQMMLRETRRTVAEIAALVGYSDLPTFRTVFHEHAGLTPAAFRSRAQAGLAQNPPVS